MLRKDFLGWVGVVGLAENKANSAPLELELLLSLAKIARYKQTNNKYKKKIRTIENSISMSLTKKI